MAVTSLLEVGAGTPVGPPQGRQLVTEVDHVQVQETSMSRQTRSWARWPLGGPGALSIWGDDPIKADRLSVHGSEDASNNHDPPSDIPAAAIVTAHDVSASPPWCTCPHLTAGVSSDISLIGEGVCVVGLPLLRSGALGEGVVHGCGGSPVMSATDPFDLSTGGWHET